MSEVLRAPHVLEYTYTRSVGPVIERSSVSEPTLPSTHRVTGRSGVASIAS